jgi:predicted MFS family arabinose efflux permease
MPAAYSDLLRSRSVAWLLATSVVGRFNQGMTGLALLLLVTQHSTYAAAGVVSASYLVGGCMAGPVLSRLADARGRRKVLSITSVLFAGAMCALSLAPARPVLMALFALLAGLCTPPLTASIRAVLPALVTPEQRRSVFALESTVQELIFILGPPLTAVLATVGGPRVAVAAAGGLALLGTLGFARDHNADAGRTHADLRLPGGRVLRSPGIAGVIVAGTALISAFACETVGVVAIVSGRHASSGSAFILACTSLGSLCGGLYYGSRRHHRAELRHLLLFVATGLAALMLAPDRIALTVLLFCWGLTIAPALSRLFERLSSLAPIGASTEAFGWMGSGLTAGNAIGSAVGGFLVTADSGRAAIAASVMFTVVAALICEPWPAFSRRRNQRLDAEGGATVGADMCADAVS